MTLLTFVLFLAIGRLLTWFLMIASPIQYLWNILDRPFAARWQVRPFSELGQCDLCLGFWVYLFLGFFLPAYGPFPWWLNLIVLAAFSSFVVHLIRLGWQAKFGTVVLN